MLICINKNKIMANSLSTNSSILSVSSTKNQSGFIPNSARGQILLPTQDRTKSNAINGVVPNSGTAPQEEQAVAE
jgi:hypothetical protein